MVLDVFANVVQLAALLLTRNIKPDKSLLSLRLQAFESESRKLVTTSRTEPQPALGDPNQWFTIALQLPEECHEAILYCCISSNEAAASSFQEIAMVKIDTKTLIGTGRLKVMIDEAAPELKLVICPRDGVSPLEPKLLINTITAAYAFPTRNTVLRELCGEVRFGYDIPSYFLAVQMSRLCAQIEKYEKLLRDCRIAQGMFSSNEEATQHLYYPCNVQIVGIRGLEQVQRHPGSKSLSSPFVSVAITSPRFEQPKQIGRTNTEYRTADPVFGSNSNLHLVEHAKPAIDFEPGRFGRIKDGQWMETYIRDDEVMKIVVFHERHSVYSGITNAPMCCAELSFNDLMEGSSTIREVKLKNVDNPNLHGGTMLLVAFLQVRPSNNPFDGLLLSPNVGAEIDFSPNLSKIPTYWLSQVIEQQRNHMNMLAMMALEIEQRRSSQRTKRFSCFKSSTDKKKLVMGAMTTNLHQCEFSVACTQAPFETRKRVAYTTCGVPAAIALGVDDLSSSISMQKVKLAECCARLNIGTRDFDFLKVAYDNNNNNNNHFNLLPGSEKLLVPCPLNPPCQKPRLNLDNTCGCLFHQPRNRTSSAASTTRSTSNSLRTAAASLASKFNSNQARTSGDAPLPITARENKSVPPMDWQVVVELSQDVFVRETIAVSQALAPTASAFIAEVSLALKRGVIDANAFGSQLMKAGFLIGWESLISTYGKEMCMLSDVIGVVEYLNSKCTIVCEVTDNRDEAMNVGIQNGLNETCDITIVVSLWREDFQSLFSKVDDESMVRLKVVIVLFSQGVNETQSISNLIHKEWASKQAEINRASIERLMTYALALNKTVPHPVLRLNATVETQREDEKKVDVLLMADDAVRALKGARQIMCKSGKDRTAMAITLEQSRIGASSLEIIPVRDVANLMREFGVRIRIAEKNVGSCLYSFNAIQRMTLPKDYRPPLSVIQDMATSYTKKDS